MQATEKRITALEQVSPETDTVMFIHLVGMGEVDKEIQHITANRKEWKREPGETEQDFQDRAERETTPSPTGCKVPGLDPHE